MRGRVQSEVVPDLEVIRELRVEADTLEADYGPNAYSDYLRRHGRRPEVSIAASIGRLLGGRVLADDGSLQPPLSASDRAAIKQNKAEREAFRKRYERALGFKHAIVALAEMGDPQELLSDDLLDASAIAGKLDSAVSFLERFARHWHVRKRGAANENGYCDGSDQAGPPGQRHH